MAARRVVLRAKDVVLLKGILEASDGLAVVFAEGGGDLIVAAHASREAELDEALAALRDELAFLSGPERIDAA
ncbi:MAG: DUF4911 domain-containing protein [Myxococcales bacterium]|jgi:hypothetical protein|nr:DUF4911 domain-containing protein [Myxococcales bacterium]MBL0197848.1 DUF4911 domain-containing protein [Myxococcales bacterium]